MKTKQAPLEEEYVKRENWKCHQCESRSATHGTNSLDFAPDKIPFDVPKGTPISLDTAQAVIRATVAEAKKRSWKMSVGEVDSGGNLVTFQQTNCWQSTNDPNLEKALETINRKSARILPESNRAARRLKTQPGGSR